MAAPAPSALRRLATVSLVTISGIFATGCGDQLPAPPPTDGGITTIQANVLQVCLYPGFPPFAEKDATTGQWSGWDHTYLQAFAAAHALTLQPVEIDAFKDIWTKPGENRCDVAATGISDLPERRTQTGTAGVWSQHYYYVVRSFAVRTGDAAGVTGVEGLANHTVIVTGDSTADLDLRNRMAQAGITSVTIETTDSEADAATKVRDAGATGEPFAYGGGYGSIEYLAQKLGGLELAWPHCNMTNEGDEFKQVPEPFSFVSRAASTGVAAALDAFIADQANQYQGPLPPCSLGLPCQPYCP